MAVEANTPGDTPRRKLLWQERIRSLWWSSGAISTEEAVPGFIDDLILQTRPAQHSTWSHPLHEIGEQRAEALRLVDEDGVARVVDNLELRILDLPGHLALHFELAGLGCGDDQRRTIELGQRRAPIVGNRPRIPRPLLGYRRWASRGTRAPRNAQAPSARNRHLVARRRWPMPTRRPRGRGGPKGSRAPSTLGPSRARASRASARGRLRSTPRRSLGARGPTASPTSKP